MMAQGKQRAKKTAILGGYRWPILIAAVAAAGLGTAAIASRRPFTVAFVDMADASVDAYSRLFPEGFRAVRVDTAAAGHDGLAGVRADCLVSRDGLALDAAGDRYDPPSRPSASAVPPSLERAMLGAGGEAAGLPLQLDLVSLSWDREAFALSGLADPVTPVALDAALAAHRDPVGPALLFAGGDDEALLQVLSALCVSRLGAKGYEAAVNAIRDGASLDGILDAPLGADAGGGAATLRSLAGTVVSWRKAGYLHPDWHEMKPADVKAFLERGYGFLVLATLSFRRGVDYQSIYRFGAAPFPSEGPRDALVAPITGLYLSPRKSMREEALAVEDRWLDPGLAYDMAKATGLATALSAARAPDVQAADALSWAAGVQTVVNGLYRDAFPDPSSAGAFAEALRAWIRSAP